MEYGTQFETLLIRPLEAMIGKELKQINCWCFYDTGEFAEDNPNQSDIKAITLHFGEETLEFQLSEDFYNAERSLGDSLSARRTGYSRISRALEDAKYLKDFSLSGSSISNSHVGKLLINVEVFGIEKAPRMARMYFDDTTLLVSVGFVDYFAEVNEPPYTLSPFGSLLLLTEQKFQKLSCLEKDTMTKLWEYDKEARPPAVPILDPPQQTRDDARVHFDEVLTRCEGDWQRTLGDVSFRLHSFLSVVAALRKNGAMYVGTHSFRVIIAFLQGYSYGAAEFEAGKEWWKFQGWVCAKLQMPPNYTWSSLFQQIYPDDKLAVEEFALLYAEYVLERRTKELAESSIVTE